MHILLIEDNDDDALVIQNALAGSKWGTFNLERTDDLTAGLARLTKGGIDAVLLDLALPDSKGLATLEKTNEQAQKIPVVVLTGLADEALGLKAMQAGAQDYLVKGQADSRLVGRVLRYAIERRRAEAALRVSEARYHDLYNNVLDMVVSIDAATGDIIECNQILTAATGYTKEEILGRRIFDMYHPDCMEEVHKTFQSLMQTGEVRAVELQLKRKDGSKIDVRVHVSAVRDEQGDIRGSLSIWRDVTERKRAEEELRQANAELTRREEALIQAFSDLEKSHEELRTTHLGLIQAEKLESVGRLAAGVAHEVKNPLATILSGVEYLSKRLGADDGNLAMLLQDMEEAVSRANAVILGLVDFSVPTQLHREPEELNAIVEKSLLLVKHELTRSHISVVKALAGNLPSLRLDRNKMQQVFVNLIMNAIQAMPEGGTLTVRTYPTKLTDVGPNVGYRMTDRFKVGEIVVVAEVEDTGTGILGDNFAKVFDPFFTTKPTGKGTGLGLAVGKKIIDLHGGTIDLRNRKDGGLKATVMLRTEGGSDR